MIVVFDNTSFSELSWDALYPCLIFFSSMGFISSADLTDKYLRIPNPVFFCFSGKTMTAISALVLLPIHYDLKKKLNLQTWAHILMWSILLLYNFLHQKNQIKKFSIYAVILTKAFNIFHAWPIQYK